MRVKRDRIEQIFSYIKEHENASTLELAEFFNVSEMTIRRDLAALEAHGRISRFYGGAVAKQTTPSEDAFALRVGMNQKYKTAIGLRAARYLREQLEHKGECPVFLGSGSSIFLMAQQLTEALPVPIITDNLHVASALSCNPDNSVIIIGGTILLPSLNATGYLAEKMLADLSVEYAFIGSSGIDENGYLCAYNLVETGMFSTIISTSRQVIILADHSKIGRSNMVRIQALSEKFTLISDQLAPEACMEHYRGMGARVIQVDC
nr:DeoR/GlpR family DNA-binding transcription regulator [Anaerofilum hominis]